MEHVLEACDVDTYANAHGHLKWENVMVDEYHSLMKNKTWDLVPRLQGKNVVKCQWAHKTKFTYQGVVERNKA